MSTTYAGVAGNVTPYGGLTITIPSDGDAATAASVNSPGPFEILADFGAFLSNVPIQPGYATSGFPTAATVAWGTSPTTGTSHYQLLWSWIVGASNAKNLRFYYRSDDGAFCISQNAIAGGGLWTADDDTKGAALFIFGGNLYPTAGASGFSAFFTSVPDAGGWQDILPGIQTTASWKGGSQFIPVASDYSNSVPDMGWQLGNKSTLAGYNQVSLIGDAVTGLIYYNAPAGNQMHGGTFGLSIVAQGSGANMYGVQAQGSGTSGAGGKFAGAGSGDGVVATAGPTGTGVYGQGGSTSGPGGHFVAEAGNANGAEGIGQGSGSGVTGQGGNGGNGQGGTFTGGSGGSSDGVIGQGGSGGGQGAEFIGTGAGAGNGVNAIAAGTGAGVIADASSSTGPALDCVPNTSRGSVGLGAIPGDPTTPSDGDIWYNSSAHTFKIRINGATKTVTVT